MCPRLPVFSCPSSHVTLLILLRQRIKTQSLGKIVHHRLDESHLQGNAYLFWHHKRVLDTHKMYLVWGMG